METKTQSVKEPARVSAWLNLLSRLFPIPVPIPIPNPQPCQRPSPYPYTCPIRFRFDSDSIPIQIPLQLKCDRIHLTPRARFVGRASSRPFRLIPEIMAPQRSCRTLEISVAHFQLWCDCVFGDVAVQMRWCDGPT